MSQNYVITTITQITIKKYGNTK